MGFNARLLLVVLGVISAICGPLKARPSPVQGGGDNVVMTVTIPMTGASSSFVQAVVSQATLMNPTTGAAIQSTIAAQDVGIVTFSDPGNYGTHDYNTIALNPDYGITVAAAALLHEYEHLINCVGGPQSANGLGGDNRVTDPCYRCIHAQMTANAWTNISDWFCELDNPDSTGVPAATVCAALDHLEQQAEQQRASCSCTPYASIEQMANWGGPCPNCP